MPIRQYRPMEANPNIFHGAGASFDLAQDSEGNVEAPSVIELIPTGEVQCRWSEHNHTFKLSDAASVVAASVASAKDGELVVDFDHGSEFHAGNSRAAGWLTNIRVEDDRIVGDVTWTAAGRAAVEAREYRFLSPTFTANDESNEIVTVRSVALTNNPAIHDLAKVASATSETKSMNPFLQAVLKSFNLPEDTSEEDALAAVNQTITASAAARTALELDDAADGEAVKNAVSTIRASAQTPDMSKFVPIKTHEAVNSELATLKSTVTATAAETAVNDAISAGKVTPAQKDWAIGYAKTDPDGFKSFAASAAVHGGAADPKLKGEQGDADPDELTEADKLVLASSAVSKEEYLKTKKAKLAAAKGA